MDNNVEEVKEEAVSFVDETKQEPKELWKIIETTQINITIPWNNIQTLMLTEFTSVRPAVAALHHSTKWTL